MAELSARTIAEMEAGAKVLADKAGAAGLPPGYMAALIRVHERHALIRKWEQDGKLAIEQTKRLSVRVEDRDKHDWHVMYHVKLPSNDGPTFTDIPAEKVGASPSELLVANIALALQAAGAL